VSGASGARASGILLHPTSLPGGPIGDLGPTAHHFVDWLVDAGQSYWQILPLVVVDEGGSPYNGLSAVAGNPFLVSFDALVADGLLTPEDADGSALDNGAVDFGQVSRWKEERLRRAHATLRRGGSSPLSAELEAYRATNTGWLRDYALFRAIRDAHRGASWTEWDPALRDREPAAVRRAAADLAGEIEFREFEQFLFDRQWSALRAYANARGVSVIGDIPIFVAHDSADVWAHPELFELDDGGRPLVVAGVPPDYFSETGQRWGNPLYRWDRAREGIYDWWVERFRRALSWVDVVRVDHFRGFESYWEIPAEEETAVRGRWRKGPGAELFRAVEQRLGALPVIAEDLGLITPDVEELREELDYPGMRVVQFGFDGDPVNPHLPANYTRHSVVYTGTHDNDTLAGWWAKASDEERAEVLERVDPAGDDASWPIAELVLGSRADLAILPVQDVLGLGSDARMNTPGTISANWTWRLRPGELTPEAGDRLRRATERSGRLASSGPVRSHHHPHLLEER
jgi:4-alpha-glucanotransferase